MDDYVYYIVTSIDVLYKIVGYDNLIEKKL